MDKFDRVYELHKLLSVARYPVPRKLIEEKLSCSKATANRIIKVTREYLHAPITHDKELDGYYYDNKLNPKYELPGLWFNASELYALLAAYQLLSEVKPGFLEPHIAPLKQRIISTLKKDHYDEKRFFNRIRILKMATRDYEQRHFALVTTALLNRRQLEIRYFGRTKSRKTQRKISPQRLIHYRDNWYLDAWCHKRKALRSFALDCIESAKLQTAKCIHISDQDLDQHYGDAYGIFAGKATRTAILHFSKTAARWVANEQWHPQQSGQHELDGSYTLKIPYSDPRELIMDVLKYGPEVEVVGPASLRKEIIKRLKQTQNRYEK